MNSQALRPARAMPSATRRCSWLALLVFAVGWAAAKNPRDNFCRRFEHQTTVIDDKLYIDGGWVNLDDFQYSHKNYSNTWLGYHDLNRLVQRNGEYWPDLNISLSKNDSIPTVSGGVLWGDAVNKRFYLYGGDWTVGFAQEPYRLLSYDILYDKWDDFGQPGLAPPPQVAAYGAGVGVSETGTGYYYGGWISNASMSGWTQRRTMSSRFYTYDYDKDTFAQAASPPDKYPRAEGALVWIPAGDTNGLLVYMGGLVSPHGNGTAAPQPLDEIFVYDAAANSWLVQTATGEIPQNRRRFCVDVAWAPDKSSFNIYLWGGLSVPPPVVNTTSFDDVYILTLPSFTWVKAYPDHHGNATLKNGHHGASCNMVKSMSQLFIVGGSYTDNGDCIADKVWAQHDFWTGTNQNAGDSDTYWALPNSSATGNVVPKDVYGVVGGDKNGGATLAGPRAGFDSGNKPLKDLLERRPSIPPRTPTRHIPGPTDSSTPVSGRAARAPALSPGAIAGIAIGGAAGLVLVLFLWFLVGKRIARRQGERRQSRMTQVLHSPGDGKAGTPSLASPQTSTGPCLPGSAPGLSSPELCTRQDGSSAVISELPTQRDINELHQ